MEPRIQYAKTEDELSIAFWTLGQGTPFVHMPLDVPLSHIAVLALLHSAEVRGCTI